MKFKLDENLGDLDELVATLARALTHQSAEGKLWIGLEEWDRLADLCWIRTADR